MQTKPLASKGHGSMPRPANNKDTKLNTRTFFRSAGGPAGSAAGRENEGNKKARG